MPKLHPSDSELDEQESENMSSSEEESGAPGKREKEHEITEYEKQRLSRIAENKARMEAMGLSKIACSLMCSPEDFSKRKGKRKVAEDDEDYRPNDEDDDDGCGDDNDDAENDDDEEFLGINASKSDKRKVKKKKSSTPKKKTSIATVQDQLTTSDYVADDDDELMQAIALSLQHPEKLSDPTRNEKKGRAFDHENAGRSKRKKPFTSRVQMTEDEVILHFFHFDDTGKGSITPRDLQRVSIVHDFVWTDDELLDMIRCFDSDGDGKLNLEDFQKIVSRCNMTRASENSGRV